MICLFFILPGSQIEERITEGVSPIVKRIIGVLVILLAIGVALIPQFTKCANAMMKCNYTAKAELGLSLPILVEGVVLVAGRKGSVAFQKAGLKRVVLVDRKESQTVLAAVGAALGISVILVPYTLIGVCNSPMHCFTLMKPALLILGVLLILANLSLLADLRQNRT